jgi:hypothetical protein
MLGRKKNTKISRVTLISFPSWSFLYFLLTKCTFVFYNNTIAGYGDSSNSFVIIIFVYNNSRVAAAAAAVSSDVHNISDTTT